MDDIVIVFSGLILCCIIKFAILVKILKIIIDIIKNM